MPTSIVLFSKYYTKKKEQTDTFLLSVLKWTRSPERERERARSLEAPNEKHEKLF